MVPRGHGQLFSHGQWSGKLGRRPSASITAGLPAEHGMEPVGSRASGTSAPTSPWPRGSGLSGGPGSRPSRKDRLLKLFRAAHRCRRVRTTGRPRAAMLRRPRFYPRRGRDGGRLHLHRLHPKPNDFSGPSDHRSGCRPPSEMTWRLQRTRTSAKLQATGSRSHTQLAHGALLGRLRQDPRNPRVPGSPAVTGPRGPWCCGWSRDGRHPPNSILPVAGTEAAVAAHGPHPARPPPAPADPQGSDHRLPGLVSNTG